jgi:hypothetical protein
LIRYHSDEKKVWNVVHVPSVDAEGKRHLHRQLNTLKGDQTLHINRIKGLLAGQGVRLEVKRDFLEQLEEVRLWDESPLPPGLRSRLEREYAGWQFVNQQTGLADYQSPNSLLPLHRSPPFGHLERRREVVRQSGANFASDCPSCVSTGIPISVS